MKKLRRKILAASKNSRSFIPQDKTGKIKVNYWISAYFLHYYLQPTMKYHYKQLRGNCKGKYCQLHFKTTRGIPKSGIEQKQKIAYKQQKKLNGDGQNMQSGQIIITLHMKQRYGTHRADQEVLADQQRDRQT